MLGKIKWWLWFGVSFILTLFVVPLGRLAGMMNTEDKSLLEQTREFISELYKSDEYNFLGTRDEKQLNSGH